MANIYEAIYNKRLRQPDLADISLKAKVVKDYFVDVIMNNDSKFNKVFKTNPLYTKKRLETKIMSMGLTEDKEEAKLLVEDALTKKYPYELKHANDYEFVKINNEEELFQMKYISLL